MMSMRERFTSERGYAVVLTALILVPLMGFAGFAVDVGAWYAQASSLQRAADAASLAGVVWQPDFVAAEAAARAEAKRNGFEHGVNDITVTVTDTGDNRLEVQIIDQSADMFFAGLFLDNVQIGRQAISEYNEPVALGAPGNTLGHQMPAGCSDVIGASGSCAGPGPGWFLDTGGPRAPHRGGEAITTQCLVSQGANCLDSNPMNPDYDASGYVFAVDVPASAVGDAITIQIFDPTHHNFTGKNIPRWDGGGTLTWLEFTLFEADGIGLTTPETTPVAGCTQIYEPVANAAYDAQWTTLCTFTPTVADIYPLRVRAEGFTGAEPLAQSQDGYSMRAVSAGANQPQFYALEYLPMLSNAEATTTFTFADIGDEHAGKTIRMRLFDAGDSNGTGQFTMRPLDPTGSTVPSCRYRSYLANEDPEAAAWNNSDNGSFCEVITRTVAAGSLYNDRWLDIEIDIPPTYSCTSCWWSVNYSLPAGVAFFERTTWTVLIVGDPVRLLE